MTDPLNTQADPWQVWQAKRTRNPVHLPQLPGIQYRRAAVLVALTQEPQPQVLLTVRSGDLPTHKGQIAFPGGSLEAGETPIQAALREAEEEVGLRPELVRVLGELDDVFTPVGFHVTPVLARIEPDTLQTLTLSAEVTQIVTPPLHELRAMTPQTESRLMPDGSQSLLYRYPWKGVDIWGMTARILHELVISGPR